MVCFGEVKPLQDLVSKIPSTDIEVNEHWITFWTMKNKPLEKLRQHVDFDGVANYIFDIITGNESNHVEDWATFDIIEHLDSDQIDRLMETIEDNIPSDKIKEHETIGADWVDILKREYNDDEGDIYWDLERVYMDAVRIGMEHEMIEAFKKSDIKIETEWDAHEGFMNWESFEDISVGIEFDSKEMETFDVTDELSLGEFIDNMRTPDFETEEPHSGFGEFDHEYWEKEFTTIIENADFKKQ